MNLKSLSSAFSGFVKNQIVGDSKDYGTQKPGEARREAEQIEGDLDRIGKDATSIGERLDRVDQDSAVQKPTFRDVSDKQVMIASTGTGAAVGGALGLTGSLFGGDPTVNIVETTQKIMAPALDGAGYDVKVYDIGPEGGPINGWDVDIHERPLTQKEVGTYTTREAQATGGPNVLLDGAKGLVLGGLGGAVLGAGTVALRRVVGQTYQGTAERQTEGDMKVLAVTGGVGAATGAGVGLVTALAHGENVTYKTDVLPPFVDQKIGEIPKGPGFYVPNTDGLQPPETPQQVESLRNGNLDKLAEQGYRGTENLQDKEVRAAGPQMEDRLIGKDRPKVDTETRTEHVGPNVVASVVGGAVVGGVTGVAIGAVVNVLRKTL